MFKRVSAAIPCLGGGLGHLRTTRVGHSRDVRQNKRDAELTNSRGRLCSHRPRADEKHIYNSVKLLNSQLLSVIRSCVKRLSKCKTTLVLAFSSSYEVYFREKSIITITKFKKKNKETSVLFCNVDTAS